MATQLPQIAITPNLVLPDYDVHTAILFTLAYSDVFDYPLTIQEMHRYLIGQVASRGEVATAANRASKNKRITNGGSHFVLFGREGNIALREKRAALSSKLWQQTLRFGRIVARFPFVRMVAATGALVSDNVDKGADLDYLIVTKPGWLWMTRALILGMDKLARRLGSQATLCPNFIITETNLALQEQDLFTAQELTRMVPISGMDIYHEMRRQNCWTDNFLPNAQGFSRSYVNGSSPSRLQTAAEVLLSNRLGKGVERWEMQRKIKKFTTTQKLNSETRFSADLCKGHFDGHKQQTMQAFEKRIEELGLNGR